MLPVRFNRVIGAETVGSRFTHVPREHRRLDLAEVHHDEAVEHIAEFTVHIECEDPAAEPQVLPEQYRNTFVVRLDLRDHPRQFVDTPGRRHRWSDADILAGHGMAVRGLT